MPLFLTIKETGEILLAVTNEKCYIFSSLSDREKTKRLLTHILICYIIIACV